MSSKDFKSLQKQHEVLLQEQSKLPDEKTQGFVKKVKEYIAQTKSVGANVSLIEEREQLRANLRYWASYIYRIEGILPDTDLPETIYSKKMVLPNIYMGFAILAIFLVIGIFLVVAREISDAQQTTTTQTPTASSIATSSTFGFGYGFDNNTMGWVPRQADDRNQAVINVEQQIKFGQSSLEVKIELIGKDEQKSKGEVFVDLSSNPPSGVTAPINLKSLDLEGKPITMRVYIPSEAIGNSKTNTYNGIQIFVTDTSDRSQYGVWWNLDSTNTNKWTTVTLVPSPKTSQTEDQNGASTNEGFDPSKINIVGLKIGAASTFDKAFVGSIWIDEVSWP